MSPTICVNGVDYEVRSEWRADLPLAEFLRDVVGLKGTKLMCREGGCGVCVVALERPQPTGEAPTTQAVHACLAPVASVIGCKVTTIEGLGNSRAGYHPIQQRLIDHHGSQCGYCSPGMVMSMYGLLKSEPRPPERQVEAAFGGNVCRCTGYRPIMDAMKSFSKDASDVTGASLIDIEDLDAKICPETGRQCEAADRSSSHVTCVKAGDVTWYRPTSLTDLHRQLVMIDGKDFRFVFGNTTSAFLKPVDVYVDLRGIASLYNVKVADNYVELGANLSLSAMMEQFGKLGKSLDGYAYLSSQLVPHLENIGSVPLRNAGCWAGNLMMHHEQPDFPSDLIIPFRALRTQLVISDGKGQTVLEMSKFCNFDMKGKVIESIRLPNLPSNRVFRVGKVMPRAVNTHCYVNAGFLATMGTPRDGRAVVKEMFMVLGGVDQGCVICPKTTAFLENKQVTSNAITDALKILSAELQPYDSQLVSATYRKNLSVNLLYKFLSELSGGDQAVPVSGLHRPLGRGRQEYQVKEDKFPVTKPSNRYTGEQQAAGETQYTWDLPRVEGELQAAVVKATIGKGRLDSIDVTEALKQPGVVTVVTAKDVPGKNATGFGFEVLAEDKIPFYGYPVALVLADTEQTAKRATDLVKVTYKDVERPITDIQEAIEKNYIHSSPVPPKVIGDPQGVLQKCAKVVEGEFRLGSQFHFYMENQVALCVPWEEGIRVWSATQWSYLVQESVASVLGVSHNTVDVHVPKIGGSFGGKIEHSAIPPSLCAIGSSKVNRPVRLMLDLPTAMSITGHRPAAIVKYKLGVDSSGQIQAVVCTVYLDVGTDFLAHPWLSKLTHEVISNVDGGYFIPNWYVEGVAVNTDHQGFSMARAPFEMTATGIAEQFMEHAARACGRDPDKVKEGHLFRTADQGLLIGVKLPCVLKLRETWDKVMSKVNFQAMKAEAEQFNKSHKWVKHGVAVTPAKFLIALSPFFNYPVFVSICAADGTVMLTHGGIEVGQGIHTKAVQMAARELQVPESHIKVKVTNTITAANAGVTRGSRTSELVCRCIAEACKVLNSRIRPFREKNPDADWKALIATCHGAGVDLATHNLHMVPNTGPANYATCGCAVAGVEVDLLTGESKVNKVDMVLDVGESINPAVDIGQVEGAFVMGLGYMMTEREVFDRDTGRLLTASTWEYKVPTNWDIPREMNVYFLKDSSNPAGVLPTRAIGEPPISLSVAVLHAIKDAIWWSRQERGIHDYFTLDVPATPERIQTMCAISDEDRK